MAKFIVYKIYCKANQKSYVGITGDFKNRFYAHWNDAKTKHTVLCRTIRKYGKASFLVFKIDKGNSWDEICELEKQYIKRFNTLVPNGMNMTNGGEGMFGISPSKETRQKISIAMKGRKITEEQKKNI